MIIQSDGILFPDGSFMDSAINNGSTVSSLESEHIVTVSAAGNGDFLTINDALTYLTKTFRPINTEVKVHAIIKLLSGFIIKESIVVDGLDLSWIVLEAEDGSTDIDWSYISTFITYEAEDDINGSTDIDRSYISTFITYEAEDDINGENKIFGFAKNKATFIRVNCNLTVINTINEDRYNSTLFMAMNDSYIEILSDNTMSDCIGCALYAGSSSTIIANRVTLNMLEDKTESAVFSFNNSYIEMNYSTINNVGGELGGSCFYALNSSTIKCNGTICSNFFVGVQVESNSTIICNDSTFTTAKTYNYLAYVRNNSYLHGEYITFTRTDNLDDYFIAIYIHGNSYLYAPSIILFKTPSITSSIENVAVQFVTSSGFVDGTISNFSKGIQVFDDSSVNVRFLNTINVTEVYSQPMDVRTNHGLIIS